MKKKLYILILIQCFIVSSVIAQLGNYWTLQVGTEGTLLSGALVAANNNTAGFFYNPASISSDSSSSFSFNTSLFRIYFLSIKNPFGEETNLNDISGNFDPIFLSYFLPRKNKLNVKLGVSLMGKQSTNYKLLDRVYKSDYSFPSIDSINGDYEGLYNYILKSHEYWVNFSASKQVNDVFSIGVTLIVAYRNINYINSISSNYVFTNSLYQNTTASFSNFTESYMYNYKILGKFGAIINLNKNNRIGINITTNSLNVFGRGTIQRNIKQTNIVALDFDTVNYQSNDQLISDFSQNLKANFKSPFSISLGYNMERTKYKMGFAVEFFKEIKQYKVITGENVGSLINTSNMEIVESEYLSLNYGQRSIVNIAISYERILNEKFTILSGFRTNFSTSKNVAGDITFQYNYLEDIILDFYHLTGGSTFTFLRNQFMLGVDLGFSFENKQPNIINFTDPLVLNDDGFPLQGNIQNNTNFSNIMLGFVLGYSLKF